jgi:hypothetical protein
MMEVVSSSETSVNFYQTTRRNNPENIHLGTPAVRTRNLTVCSSAGRGGSTLLGARALGLSEWGSRFRILFLSWLFVHIDVSSNYGGISVVCPRFPTAYRNKNLQNLSSCVGRSPD